MRIKIITTTLAALLLAAATLSAQNAFEMSAENVPPITELFGMPNIIQTALGPAVEFDGVGDGVFVDSVPVAGMEEFTLEMVFMPYGNAPFEQRFMHMGSYGAERIMFETRVLESNEWYFDAFVKLKDGSNKALIDEKLLHPTDRWYSLALTCSKDGIVSYVDGVRQCEFDLHYVPDIAEGVTSLGVRQNKVCWFKGAILKLRVTPKVLDPKDFLQDHKILNK